MDWIWLVGLPLFHLLVLGGVFWLVVRGRGPRRFGPRTYLPRWLAPQQEKLIGWFLFQGNRDGAVRAYADATGADHAESTWAIEHWSER